MRTRVIFYLGVAITVVLFDAGASFVSRTFHINYVNFILGSWGIYAASGYFACRHFRFWEGVLSGTVAGLSDSTLGWGVSFLIGPYPPFQLPDFTPVLLSLVIISVVFVVTVSGAFFGLLGALLCKLVGRLGHGKEVKS
jgi:hypothetical protein